MSAGSEFELENVLQQIFTECDSLVSTPMMNSSTVSVDGHTVPVTRIIGYIQEQLPTWSIDKLAELWRDLVTVSTNDRVDLDQFKETTKRWIAKMQQDGNNNSLEKYLANDADSSMKTMDKDIVGLELRVKFRKLNEENVVLRDELERCEELINTLRQEHSITKQQLKHYIKKCQQFEKENDEQRDQLNELLEKEKIKTLNLQRCMKEKENLLKQLEAAEIEIQIIPSLKEKLEMITKEKMNCIEVIAKMQEEFDEKENNFRHLKSTITELQDSSINIKENYECVISSLREKNRLLADENEELQSLSLFSVYPSRERLSTSPILNTDVCNMHSTPYKSTPAQDSLYMELKASGFTAECSRSDRKDLEEELNEYDVAIFEILEQLEKVIQVFVTMRGSDDDSPHFTPQDTNARVRNVDILKHKASFLLKMVTKMTRRNTRQDSSTQLRADPANATDSLDQFGIESFRNLLSTQTHRSIHTLLLNLQPSSLIAEDSRSQTFGYQHSETNTIDVPPFAQGDGLMQEDKKSMPLAVEVSNWKDFVHTEEENRSTKMPKVLQVDTKATLATLAEKTDARSFQVSDMSGTNNPTSPRRKIAVYCRSFDVVAVQDRCDDHPGSNNLEVRQSSKPDDSPARIESARDQNNTPDKNHPFNNYVYRNVKSDSDSSNSTPGKYFQDSMDDEPPIEPQSLLRNVRLAPTRLRFPEIRNEMDKTVETVSNRASPVPMNSTELDISMSSLSSSSLSPIDRHRKYDNISSSISPKLERKSAALEFKSSNENALQIFSMPKSRLFPCNQADSAKITDSEDPHSQASVQRVSNSESQSRFERSVDSQMSSREDSFIVSEPRKSATVTVTAGSVDVCSTIDEKVTNEAVDVISSTPLTTDEPVSAEVVVCKNVAQTDEKARERNRLTKQKTRQSRFFNTKRSHSEGENIGRKLECHCKRRNRPLIPEGFPERKVFPSLTDARLEESGISNLSDSELECGRENPSELELQKKYTAFSLCLCIDRLTLPRRIAMSIRQRDQSEKNLSSEVANMQQDIQELAPLCMDRESAERVDRVRHRLDMIVRCAHRVSCTAETLGAVHQESRVSRAVLLADKYLHLLHSRCEKLIASVAETKRILLENNITIEENSSELNDELPRLRYRSGTIVNNRMMMARRRASVATMSRPMGSTQDVTKDIVRQRNSVSGRMMTLRRPSFTSESAKWEIEKLDRTESSNSINELRDIFEQAESRRSSREENNNTRLSHSNSQSTINCATSDNDVWADIKEREEEEETISPEVFDNENIYSERRLSTKSPHSFQLKRRKRRLIWPIILSILFFFLLFQVIRAMVTNHVVNHVCQNQPLNKLIDYVIERYRQMKKVTSHPM
ncbi:uncharacterized protein LOC105830282 [Monomorium pharaonis]|uniref:uncharacterized protein LOC105830282 n=1 Tax=Monomorium pharaonis TaxID=307658 RepID=UPI00063F10A0|nr:uncharacterized protein LOC105830282 [Monomorium pharaonis]